MMNQIFFLLSFALAPMMGQQQELKNALEKADAEILGGFFAEQVEISIFDKDQTLSKQKAKAMTINFFEAHAISGFKKMHEGASKDQKSQYLIGKLTSKEQSYRVFIYYVLADQELQINELRVER